MQTNNSYLYLVCTQPRAFWENITNKSLRATKNLSEQKMQRIFAVNPDNVINEKNQSDCKSTHLISEEHIKKGMLQHPL